jgi:hypothetical protein
MRSLRYGWLLIFLFLTALSWGKQTSQQAPAPQATRDPQAVAALQQAVAAMGAALPSDSVATGSVIVVAGTETDQGTIRILTRGTDQTLEQTDTPQAVRTEVFSQGQASETVGTAATPFPLERAATAQCRDFPLPYLLALLNNSEESLTFVGTEQLGVSALHVRATNTYASQKRQQFLADFSTTDLWIDAKTFLPLKVAHVQRDGGGSAPRTRMEIFFTDYQSTGGVLYPRTIRKSWNGTPWMTITVQTVSYNTGLTDANFPVTEVPQ